MNKIKLLRVSAWSNMRYCLPKIENPFYTNLVKHALFVITSSKLPESHYLELSNSWAI